MAVRPPEHQAPGRRGAEAVDIGDLPPLREASKTRVMSVSPRDADHAGPAEANDLCEQEVFLTPRVVDQRSFDDITSALRTLIEQANDAVTQLEARLEDARRQPPAPDSERLQERLLLGARMLKAFQGQINRVEADISRLDSREREVAASAGRLDKALAAADARTEEAIESFRTRLGSLAEEQISGLERRLGARAEELARLDECVRQNAAQADSLLKLVELSEQKTVTLLHRHAASIASLEARSAEAQEIMHQCDDAERLLGESVLSAADRIDELEARSEEICRNTDRKAVRSQEAAKELFQALAEAGSTAKSLDQVHGAVTELRDLLERLKPWEKLLLESPLAPDGTPRPVAAMIESLRTGLVGDLTGLSLAMRGLADRVDRVIPLQEMPEETGVIELTEPARATGAPCAGEADRNRGQKDEIPGAAPEAADEDDCRPVAVITGVPDVTSATGETGSGRGA